MWLRYIFEFGRQIEIIINMSEFGGQMVNLTDKYK
jgi:hypothetical protein